jgi:DNA primase
VPSRIIRDSVAEEIAQKLNIDSQVLRQELKHAAVSRKSATVKPPTEAQVTDAEKIMIRALASESQFQSEDCVSDRSGADDAFEPARQAKYVLSSERLHVGLGTESLIEMLLDPEPDTGVMDIPLSDGDRQLLAAILLKDDEELTAEKVEGATRALRRVQIRRRLEQIQRQLETFRGADGGNLKQLMDEKLRLKKILMDPNLGAAENLDKPA